MLKGPLVLLPLTTLALLARPTSAQVPDCNQNLCFSNTLSSNPASLQCGTALRISNIIVATRGSAPTSSCDLVTSADPFVFNASGTCFDASVRSVVEELCLGRSACEVSSQSLGPSACGPDPTFTILVECAAPTFDFLSILSLGLIMVVAFAVGCTLTRSDFLHVINNNKKAVLIGFSSQFGFMPLLAFALAKICNLSPLVAIGTILVGAAPGGTGSNLFSHLSHGNVALSVCMSFLSSLMAIGMLPLMVTIYIDSSFSGSSSRPTFPYTSLFISLAAMVVPTALGVLLRETNTQSKIGGRFLWQWVEGIGSVVGLVFIVGMGVVGCLQSPQLLDVSRFWKVWTIAAVFQPTGAAFGFAVGALLGLCAADRRTVAFETGVQNVALIIAIATISYSGCDREAVLVFPLVAGFWYCANSVLMVLFFRYCVGEPVRAHGQSARCQPHVSPERSPAAKMAAIPVVSFPTMPSERTHAAVVPV